ncbi:MAG: DUF3820 family protein [Roseimicrobium sp.]
MPSLDLAKSMADDLAAIERMPMPFGKFGPQNHPPSGVPIYDLPVEYLAWFAKKGFPKGQLGRLLQIVHQMKVDGSDFAFDAMRQRRGGRTVLREQRTRVWEVPPDRPQT